MMARVDYGSHERLVQHVIREASLQNPAVRQAFEEIPRSFFFPLGSDQAMFADGPVKVGHFHQSQPSLYGKIMELLDLRPGERFLNVGSGTGYLSALCAFVMGIEGVNHGIEIHKDLVDFATTGVQNFFKEKGKIMPIQFTWGNVFEIDVANNIKYSRIYVGAGLDEAQARFVSGLLDNGGVMIAPVGCEMIRFSRPIDGGACFAQTLFQVRFAEIVPSSKPAGSLVIESRGGFGDLARSLAPKTKPTAKAGFVSALQPSASRQQPKSVFLSFNVKTLQDNAEALYDELKRAGYHPWICTRDIVSSGVGFREQIIEALKSSEFFVALANRGWAESPECSYETSIALTRNISGNGTLCPKTVVPVFFPDIHDRMDSDNKIIQISVFQGVMVPPQKSKAWMGELLSRLTPNAPGVHGAPPSAGSSKPAGEKSPTAQAQMQSRGGSDAAVTLLAAHLKKMGFDADNAVELCEKLASNNITKVDVLMSCEEADLKQCGFKLGDVIQFRMGKEKLGNR